MEQHPVESYPIYSVEGVLENTSKKTWSSIFIELKFYSENSLVDTCEEEVKGVAANEKRSFSVFCYKISRSKLPKKHSAKVT